MTCFHNHFDSTCKRQTDWGPSGLKPVETNFKNWTNRASDQIWSIKCCCMMQRCISPVTCQMSNASSQFLTISALSIKAIIMWLRESWGTLYPWVKCPPVSLLRYCWGTVEVLLVLLRYCRGTVGTVEVLLRYCWGWGTLYPWKCPPVSLHCCYVCERRSTNEPETETWNRFPHVRLCNVVVPRCRGIVCLKV